MNCICSRSEITAARAAESDLRDRVQCSAVAEASLQERLLEQQQLLLSTKAGSDERETALQGIRSELEEQLQRLNQRISDSEKKRSELATLNAELEGKCAHHEHRYSDAEHKLGQLMMQVAAGDTMCADLERRLANSESAEVQQVSSCSCACKYRCARR